MKIIKLDLDFICRAYKETSLILKPSNEKCDSKNNDTETCQSLCKSNMKSDNNKIINEAYSVLNIGEITNSLKSTETEISTETTQMSEFPRQNRDKTSKNQNAIIIKGHNNYFEEFILDCYQLISVKTEMRAGKQLLG